MPASSRPWWQTGVVYQIYPRSFADADGDGIGDLDGITARLDHLSDTLGVDAIWLSPFFPSPQADFGYDVADFCDVDPMYGDLAAFDRLVAAAHDRGLRVIVDYVINHSSDRHRWFVESRSSRRSPKRDWYVWRDPKPDGSEPNNWVSLFGGKAWTWDEPTGQFYLHSFLAEQPDFNWRNPELAAAMFDVLRFWLDRGVDGFRIDVAHRAMKDPLMRDLPLAAEPPEEAYKLNPEYAALEHFHDVAHPDIHRLFREMRALVDSYPGHRALVGEIHEYDWPVWASYYGGQLDELHMPFNFVLLPTGPDPVRIREAIAGLEAALPDGAWPNWVVGNHDEPRVATRWGPEAAKAAAVLLLTLRGTPTIYQGDECGTPDLFIPAELQQDPWGRRMPGFGRDGCRTPLQWTTGDHAGFSPPEAATTWLPVHGQERISIEAQLGDPGSYLELYRSLLRLRRSRPALHAGEIRLVGEGNPLTYERHHAGERPVSVAINLSEEAARLEVDGRRGATVVAATDPARLTETLSGPTTLRPWEALVLE
jgi:alpha-glucosidase